jgi:aryl-alcohol dehydrogenase
MPGCWDGEARPHGAGAGGLRPPPWRQLSHYEDSIWLGQEFGSEIPLLRGAEPPDVVTRWHGSFSHTRSTGFGAADPHWTVGSARERRKAPISGGNSVPAFAHRAKRRGREKGQQMQISAAVVQEVGAPFALTEVELQEPAPDEVVVEIAGAGICHTDIAVQHGHLPFPLPGVLGHEGSGTVVEVGADVTSIAVGDDVAISFNSCGTCPTCSKGQPAYCHNFLEYNFGGVRSDGSSGLASAGTKLGANFFGQSSLATHALAHERNVVKLPPGAPVELVGPLGCGIQTGAGAVFNSLDVQPGATVVIAGSGAVGLSAVMAAVVRKAASIIAVDLHESRRVLATELGATHAIDPQAGPLADQIREIAPAGADYAVDTTAVTPVVEQLLASLGMRGMLGLIGVPADPQAMFSVGLFQPPLLGLTIRGIVEGDADPQTFIPYLLALHDQGKFPFDKLITTMPLAQINEAVEAQHRGEVLKAVLTP